MSDRKDKVTAVRQLAAAAAPLPTLRPGVQGEPVAVFWPTRLCEICMPPAIHIEMQICKPVRSSGEAGAGAAA